MNLPARPSSGSCPICHSREERGDVALPEPAAACPRCGWWYSAYDTTTDKRHAPAAAEAALDRWVHGPNPVEVAHRRSRLSHLVRRQQRGRPVGVPAHSLELWSLDDPLPSPPEQADNLVLWVGDRQQADYSRRVTIDRANAPAVAAWLGVPITPDDLGMIGWLAGALAGRLLDLEIADDAIRASLTLTGWDHHVALRRTASESRRAFMTMKFGDPQLNEVFERCFKPAV
ncbi:MAG TPA: hypothetical protein VKQ70_01570, partial [Caulobacteraceae bacterium]|nr:hypothetical protein [Caulobacteraceae bacterium]